MKWIIENWSLLVVILCVVIVAAVYVKKFAEMPSEEQIKKVKEWLLWAVIYTEKELKSGTGAAKLRFCYDLFVQRFPGLVDLISFETFSNLVDEALEQMKHLLDTNLDIRAYVEGE